MTVSEYLAKSLESGIEPMAQIQTGMLSPGSVVDLIHELLFRLGEDPEREGLEKTPERVSRMYSEILAGYQTNLEELVNGAIFGTENQDMVVVRDIQFFSMCEHHLLPFFGKAHVAYIPNGNIIGLSKIPRLVEMYARRLQVQERMTHQIAETLESILHPLGVAVFVEGYHLCAMMRGVRQTEANLATSTMSGVFEQNGALRTDFFNQIHLRYSPGHGIST
ncbi:MAG TPA: GTP cyclohydrolase I FolE [Leptolinea sp.]